MCSKGPSNCSKKSATVKLRLDRTIEVSVTNTTEKKRIMKRIWPNLATLKKLLKPNFADYNAAVSHQQAAAEKSRAAWQLDPPP
jgi:RNA polymerase primary sigma factor